MYMYIYVYIYIHTYLFICIYYCCPQYVSKFYINQKGLGNLDCFNYEPNLLRPDVLTCLRINIPCIPFSYLDLREC